MRPARLVSASLPSGLSEWKPARKASSFHHLGGSSNGRTPDSGSGYQGSNPCPPARRADQSASHSSLRVQRPHRLAVRTPASHVGNMGSIPIGVATAQGVRPWTEEVESDIRNEAAGLGASRGSRRGPRRGMQPESLRSTGAHRGHAITRRSSAAGRQRLLGHPRADRGRQLPRPVLRAPPVRRRGHRSGAAGGPLRPDHRGGRPRRQAALRHPDRVRRQAAHDHVRRPLGGRHALADSTGPRASPEAAHGRAHDARGHAPSAASAPAGAARRRRQRSLAHASSRMEQLEQARGQGGRRDRTGHGRRHGGQRLEGRWLRLRQHRRHLGGASPTMCTRRA
jgi:hypothetical protein